MAENEEDYLDGLLKSLSEDENAGAVQGTNQVTFNLSNT